MTYPLPKSTFGDQLYAQGRTLAEDYGLRLEHLIWDADELLWDWTLSARRAALGIPKMLLKRGFGHREWVRLKPGVWELIWGIKDGQDSLGELGYMRISTNGYHWRLFRYAQDIPGFADLIGAPANPTRYEGYRDHPNIFCRIDYAHCMKDLFLAQAADRLDDALEILNEPGRAVVRDHFLTKPFKTSLKLPELAQLLGKTGFDEAFVLIDDSGRNCKWFMQSGRVGVRASVPAKHTSRIPPNVAFTNPRTRARELSNNLATPLAQRLLEVAQDRSSRFLVAQATDDVPADYPALEFEVEIPDSRIGDEWFEPVSRLKADYGHER